MEFVGYAFRGYGGRIQVSQKKINLFKRRASKILNRNRGISMWSRLHELKLYLRGWIDYFIFGTTQELSAQLGQVASATSPRVLLGSLGACHALESAS